jgi:hypothetical protein
MTVGTVYQLLETVGDREVDYYEQQRTWTVLPAEGSTTVVPDDSEVLSMCGPGTLGLFTQGGDFNDRLVIAIVGLRTAARRTVCIELSRRDLTVGELRALVHNTPEFVCFFHEYTNKISEGELRFYMESAFEGVLQWFRKSGS